MTDASTGEPMARGGRSPHSVLLAWLGRYVKQLLLIWSPQSRGFGGLVCRPVALASPPWCRRRGPWDGTKGRLGVRRPRELSEGQARKESSWRRPLASVRFQAGPDPWGGGRPGPGSPVR